MMKALLAALMVIPTMGMAGSKFNEAHYSSLWCDQAGGREEVQLPSGARADCLTDEFAVEVDWSNKWAEAIGQSLHYAEQTGKKPAVVILIHEKSKQSHLYRLDATIANWGLPIEVFVIDAPKN